MPDNLVEITVLNHNTKLGYRQVLSESEVNRRVSSINDDSLPLGACSSRDHGGACLCRLSVTVRDYHADA